MWVTYNSVQLQVEHVAVFEQKNTYSEDGTEILWTHYRLGVHFLFNPSATNDPVAPQAYTADIVAKVRAKLLEPRKLLTFDPGGSQYWLLYSPPNYLDANNNPQPFACDAKNGPSPVCCNILAFHGEHSFSGYFEIETWLPGCSNVSSVISHRWSMTNELDLDYYTVRQIEGEVIFNKGYLLSTQDPSKGQMSALMPDDYRSAIFHPIPPTYKRTKVVVAASSDGTSLRYTIVDEEQAIQISPAYRSITRIDGEWNWGWETGSYINASVSPTFATGRNGQRGGFGLSGGVSVDFGRKWVGIALKVWGTRKTTRADLVNALAKAAATYGFSSITAHAFFTRCDLKVSVARKEAELMMACSVPSAVNLENTLLGTNVVLPAAFNIIPTKTQAPGYPNSDPNGLPEGLGDVAVLDDTTPTTPPPNDFGTRGTSRAKVWAQLLKAGCQTPYLPSTLDPKLPPPKNMQWQEPT